MLRSAGAGSWICRWMARRSSTRRRLKGLYLNWRLVLRRVQGDACLGLGAFDRASAWPRTRMHEARRAKFRLERFRDRARADRRRGRRRAARTCTEARGRSFEDFGKDEIGAPAIKITCPESAGSGIFASSPIRVLGDSCWTRPAPDAGAVIWDDYVLCARRTRAGVNMRICGSTTMGCGAWLYRDAEIRDDP